MKNNHIDGPKHQVLVNQEGQYSIWPEGQKIPAGWSKVGPIGSKDECREYIDKNWIDMKPISLQRKISTSN